MTQYFTPQPLHTQHIFPVKLNKPYKSGMVQRCMSDTGQWNSGSVH